ncbi:methylated-DNA--[protein]-cysteine S-methyltransferase [Clostridium niameyense]|uniref:methylated-DNA--[protein]-cysteine S-methyltransferase n=1 Tax=Clostridium niameyense TaxID=1622073 RepID=UPI00067F6666
MSIFFYETIIGNIGIEEKENKIFRLYFQGQNIPGEIEIKETYILKNAGIQLKNYLNGKLKKFSLPLYIEGTDFSKKVWEVLCEIPYGRTLTYKQVAEKVGNPKAARAVGFACNKNPIPIFIPCHRIIGSSGNLTGYLGGLKLKNYLLNMEKHHI